MWGTAQERGVWALEKEDEPQICDVFGCTFDAVCDIKKEGLL
jgi:hypothetical protein